MKANKKRSVPSVALVKEDYDQWGRFNPLDPESYPLIIETDDRIYWRIYVRARVIVYEVLYKVTKARDHWYTIPEELKFYDFDKMCEYVDKSERNNSLSIIAKQ